MLTRSWNNEILSGFIVFEGVDGAGTTTQAHMLCDFLNSTRGGFTPPGGPAGQAHFTCEPTDFLTGRTIRTLLRGPEYVEPWTLALLFAADRNEHLHRPESGIISLLSKGMRVVSDRYLFSSLAYQGAYADFVAVERLNVQFPLPEHLVFIDTPRATAQERMRQREVLDSLEQVEVQERVEQMYRQIILDFEETGHINVHRFDGTLPIDILAAEIRKTVTGS